MSRKFNLQQKVVFTSHCPLCGDCGSKMFEGLHGRIADYDPRFGYFVEGSMKELLKVVGPLGKEQRRQLRNWASSEEHGRYMIACVPEKSLRNA